MLPHVGVQGRLVLGAQLHYLHQGNAAAAAAVVVVGLYNLHPPVRVATEAFSLLLPVDASHSNKANLKREVGGGLQAGESASVC